MAEKTITCRNFLIICLCILIPITLSSAAFGASANIQVNIGGDGLVSITGTGSFATCNGSNYGSVNLQCNGAWVYQSYILIDGVWSYSSPACSAEGYGSAAFTCYTDRYFINDGTSTFSVIANDCTRQPASADYAEELDNAHVVTYLGPSGQVTQPFDIIASVVFQPTQNPIKGYITCGVEDIGYVSKSCESLYCSCLYKAFNGLPNGTWTVYAGAITWPHGVSSNVERRSITIISPQDRTDGDKGSTETGCRGE